MTRLLCSECGEPVVARSVFEAEGECPHCGAEAGSLVEQDAYDEGPRELRCAECGWDVEAGVRTQWDGVTSVYTVDDDCPVCASVGWQGVLEPVTADTPVRSQPEHRMARAAADRTRGDRSGPPLDVEALAADLALTVRRGPFGHQGMLGGTTIEVPAGHPGAERFVIAHEIGHHVLGHEHDRHKIEPEANAFASELLMPRAWLTEAVREGLNVDGLARRFAVSRQAVVYALRSASLLGRVGR